MSVKTKYMREGNKPRTFGLSVHGEGLGMAVLDGWTYVGVCWSNPMNRA